MKASRAKPVTTSGGLAGQPGSAFLVASRGGPAEALLRDGKNGMDVRDPDWSPDGRTLVVSRATSAQDDSQRVLDLVNFQTRQFTKIPGFEDLAMTRWSYDGRYVSATSEDQHSLKLLDVARKQWREIAHGEAFGIAEWSPDSRYVYFQDLLAPGEPLFRYEPATARVTKVADFTLPLAAGALRCAFWSVDPAGNPIMCFDRSGADLYSAAVRLP